MYSKKKVFNGLLWSLVDKIGLVVLQLIMEIVLARLLSPKDYGIMAIVMVLLALGMVFSEGGFTNALINKKDRNSDDYSTAFISNLSIALFLYGILFFSADWISRFFNEPILLPVIRILGLNIIFNALTIVHKTQISLNLNFKTQAFISFIGLVISGIIAVFLAINGFGVWALVFQSLSLNVVYFLLYFILIKWKPRLYFSKSSFQYLFGFSSKILAAGVIQNVYMYSYNVFIGKYLSTFSLGIYNKSNQFTQMPVGLLSNVVQRVTYPYFSTLQDNDEKVFNIQMMFSHLVAFLFFPLMVVIAVLSEPFVVLILNEKWTQMIPILRILAFAFLFFPIIVNNMLLFQLKNKPQVFLNIEIVTKAIGIIILLMTIMHGLVWISYGILISLYLQYIITSLLSCKLINNDAFIQLKQVLPFFFLGIIVFFCCIWGMSFFEDFVLKIFIGLGLFFMQYGFVYYFFNKKTLTLLYSQLRAIK